MPDYISDIKELDKEDFPDTAGSGSLEEGILIPQKANANELQQPLNDKVNPNINVNANGSGSGN